MTKDEIRAARQALGMSQSQLGKAVGGANARTVRRWESGESQVPGSVAKLLERLVEDSRKDVAA